ncbi:hypothetical protein FMM74_015120 [Lachnospiraceae bacterium MD308]|nr:hypothetical protein [Lachnospiraceae bacterium MD308]
MQEGNTDNRNHERIADSRNYAPDKPKECRHCYFWRGKRKCCSRRECYYLLPTEERTDQTVIGKQSQELVRIGDCQCCPYGRHSPCIGFCIRKIMLEMKERKQTAGKEGNGIAG